MFVAGLLVLYSSIGTRLNRAQGSDRAQGSGESGADGGLTPQHHEGAASYIHAIYDIIQTRNFLASFMCTVTA